MDEWINVKDRLPEIGKNVLIYYPKWDGDEIQVAKLDCDGIMFDVCGEFDIGTGCVTHWMSLPEPPKDGDKDKQILKLQEELEKLKEKPVKRGRWEDCSNGWMCSCCERDSTKDTPFCPNCGARMDGDVK